MSLEYTFPVHLDNGDTYVLVSATPLGIVDSAYALAADTEDAELKARLESQEFTDSLIAKAVFTLEAEDLIADFAKTLAGVDNPEFVADESVTLEAIFALPSVRDAVATLRHVLAPRMLDARQAS